jgi:alkylation response protein AidB-like acyl-CoA dehydrogenase
LVFALTLEALAKADASAAWCVAQCCGCSVAGAYLDPDIAREIFSPADAVVAWGPLPRNACAVETEGGFRVTGSWMFASGSRQASWLGAHCVVCGPDGAPKMGENGRPTDRTVLIRRSQAQIEDVWHVMGLRGTGSDNYKVADLFVPSAYSFTRDSDADRREKGPLYRFSILSFYGIAFAAIAIGIARAMLDDFRRLAPNKTPQGAGQTLHENSRVQAQLAKAEAKLRSSRVYLHETLRSLWSCASAGETFSLEQRIDLRLSSTCGIQAAREVADWSYHSAGATAIFAAQPFERRFRDINTVSQQVQANESNLELAGKALMGLPTGGRL